MGAEVDGWGGADVGADGAAEDVTGCDANKPSGTATLGRLTGGVGGQALYTRKEKMGGTSGQEGQVERKGSNCALKKGVG